ncbi:tyrosine-type recombinase/integrase [Halobellus marinus]|uniref:tyrosine-type recombinase/integrase n=1 Tax=Halobellus TaxID=1073986 RepID=UPI0028A99A8F|nr:site-specific integrase [Halobellus sp. DFY28]
MSQVKKAGIRLVTKPAEDYLSERQLTDYREHRERLIDWMVNIGKDPEHGDGYAYDTANGRAYRLDLFYRNVWKEQEGRYTTEITHDHADAYMKELAYGDTSQENKASHLKAVKMLFRWRAYALDGEEWEPEITFSPNTGNTNPKDFLTREERGAVREAVLEHGSVPSYNALTPEQRDRWKIHLAQRFEMPKKDVGPDEFKRANSWKVPSLFWTALDAGLRPIEVQRSKVQWLDIQNALLRIPKQDSSKNSDNWTVSLTDRTANALDRWLTERATYDKYQDSDSIWLNRSGNPYNHHSLNRLFQKVCTTASIPSEGRTFYSIRHSTATYMAREEDLAAAQAQLRHKSPQTTMRYDQAPVEDRRDALNRMG